MKNKLIYLGIFLGAVILGVASVKLMYSGDPDVIDSPDDPVIVIPDVTDTGNFAIDLLKRVNEKENFLVSPYSIEVALNMLKSGAVGETKEEIEKVVPTRDLKISNNNVKISNALFVKNDYKSVIEKSFENTLTNKYNSKVLYDKFKTPNVINNWVKESTDGMIEKILDRIDPDFVLGLANAIAIDVKWVSEFECDSTTSEEFKQSESKTLNVEMMHQHYGGGIKYLDEESIKGVIIPYKENLEFVALLPKEDLKDYINNLDIKTLNNTISSFKELPDNLRLNLSLPRFSYSYDLNGFIEVLKNMGIKSVFDPSTSDLSGMISKENLTKLGIDNLYVSDAIHKTYIDLNERGTKAAAVTYFGVKAGSMLVDETVNIKFNKPFLYMIRDTETKEILFMGSVYSPNKWNGSTCEKN